MNFVVFVVVAIIAFTAHANAQLPVPLPVQSPCITACLEALVACKVKVCPAIQGLLGILNIRGCVFVAAGLGLELCASLCAGGPVTAPGTSAPAVTTPGAPVSVPAVTTPAVPVTGK